MRPSESCSADPEPAIARALSAVAQQARNGDVAALQRLRQFLDKHPDAWAHIGDLDQIVTLSWVALLANGDPLSAEAFRRKADELRRQLEGETPSPTERSLVGQVVASWLELAHAQTQGAQADLPARQGAYLIKRVESAQRRYLAALKTLTTLRATLASGLVPAQQPRVLNGEKVRA